MVIVKNRSLIWWGTFYFSQIWNDLYFFSVEVGGIFNHTIHFYFQFSKSQQMSEEGLVGVLEKVNQQLASKNKVTVCFAFLPNYLVSSKIQFRFKH